ncbi:hypothetical protein IEQ34_003921 [Dendrobium chrysotoxum]|uniref:Uncharacterized protein n=1 Tax=Dendrobium chrysotoxum TaxID=161865 RepID=A0AAV7HGT7_DENCH|nr:hypothetical protein IEQ34_003921 [Dendrobium chrysotoxum]
MDGGGGGGGNDDEPDQDLMVPSSRAIMVPEAFLNARGPLRLRFSINTVIIGVRGIVTMDKRTKASLGHVAPQLKNHSPDLEANQNAPHHPIPQKLNTFPPVMFRIRHKHHRHNQRCFGNELWPNK